MSLNISQLKLFVSRFTFADICNEMKYFYCDFLQEKVFSSREPQVQLPRRVIIGEH